MSKKIVFIGGGPGGYVGAIRAAKMGASVTLIEKRDLGGTCLNRGCIPTKALVEASHYATAASKAAKMGVNLEYGGTDSTRLYAYKDSVVKKLTGGVKMLLKKNGVEVMQGTASFENAKTLRVIDSNGQTCRIQFDAAVIATGSVPSNPSLPGVDLPGVIDSDGAISLGKVPPRMVIIGGGVVGVEFATVFGRTGSDVTVIEMLPRVIATMDSELSQILDGSLKREGIKVITSAKVQKIEKDDSGLVVYYEKNGVISKTECDVVLMAAGRKANTAGLNLEMIGVKTEKGHVVVDSGMRSNFPGIYAIGDAAGGIMLAHVASAEAGVAVDNILGKSAEMRYSAVPECIYTDPEIASVGLTEDEARSAGLDIRVGRFPMIGCGRAIAADSTDGFIKIVVDAKYEQILGVQIAGARASDLIGEATLAISGEMCLDDLINVIHPHPSFTEALGEAALDVNHQAIHI